ncbi:hypothetical protein GUITHDRAFT_150085 [Guillardia theta CCMP2712]|uniref:Uncharacterized protein n=1 Tax=Guillardia theta (strain CCMP2712) TaxID=905079 RepID=L1K0C9_GUITC|nr:hypothetical protein GUITHDRAFT_150085 [Guillardia theta CCMP2712]EKX53900.1 hypothetical protein GUITHDRAFT_150085 [Guillardia theta CCMP2712]|eukprot:XP_005840880.1 hypothetical protein GUITHDRAFT_150085 [Guillardia theta CCMP2712]
MERRPNQMERRENGQKRAGELQMTQKRNAHASHLQWASEAEEQILTASSNAHEATTDRSVHSTWVETHKKDNAPGNIISQNVNGCSQFVLKHILAYLIEKYHPSIVIMGMLPNVYDQWYRVREKG